MTTLAITVRRKVYRDGPITALENVNLQVAPGQFVAIVGPSGAGKTSLLNIVAGLDPEFEGELRTDGADGAGATATVPRTAFVFQTPRLMPWLTVLDNVHLVLKDRDTSEVEIRALLAQLGLAGFEQAFPGQLSGGMQRRVALARAFAVHPELLLMDEPFVSLDEPLALRLRDQLVELWQQLRPTVLYVTHNLQEALSLADRVLFMSPRPGRIILDQSIALPRPRRPDAPQVARLRARLLERHPELLSGLVNGDAGLANDRGLEASKQVPAA